MNNQYNKLGIRGKSVLGLAVLLMLSLIVTTYSSYITSKQVAERKVIELEQKKLSVLKRDIEGSLKGHENIIRSLSGVPPALGTIRAKDNNGIDPETGVTFQSWKARLTTIFSAFIENHQDYLQVRLIDKNGQELVRVEAGEDAEAEVVDWQSLQNKSGRDYVSETLKLKQGQVYISRVELNKEHGEIQEPYVPVMRLATPVFDDQGNVRALIVINRSIGHMFSTVKNSDDNNIQRSIVDERGYYIKHADKAKNFAAERGLDYNFYDIHPELAVLSKTEDKVMRLFEDKQEIAGFQKIYFSPLDRSQYWLLTLNVSEDVVFADIVAPLNTMLFTGLVIALLSVIIIIGFVSKRVVKPVLNLADAAQRLQQGDLSVRLDESIAYDEFQTLYRAINTFAESQQYATGELKREIESQNRRLAAVIDNVVDGIITITSDGKIETFNAAATAIFGYQQDEVVGKDAAMLLPEEGQNAYKQYLTMHGQPASEIVSKLNNIRENVGLRKDGTSFPMELAISDLFIDGEQHYVGIVRDITDRKRVERMQKEFVSTVSHELRTPLTSISGSLALILAGSAGELPPKALKLLSIASNNSERLINLVNDILDIEKITAGKMQYHFSKVDLLPVLRAAMEANKGYADKFKVYFECDAAVDGPIYVNIDQKRIEQVLSNLLSNAAKYSPPNKPVIVAVQRRAESVRVSVQDQGKGVPEAFKPKIFSKFSQADSSDTREKGGTGLGLSITKAIVEQHQGSIGFISEKGLGTTFYFDLPLCQSEQSSTVKANINKQTLAKILIVEDDKDVSNLLAILLEEAGFTYEQAYSYSEALEKIKHCQYAAVTLDLKLPGGSGIQLLRHLRSHNETMKTPVVVVSAIAKEGEKEVQGDSFEMVDWIPKPIDGDRLLESIRIGIASALNAEKRILHVEDDPDIATIVDSLVANQYTVKHALTLRQAKQLVEKENFDLVLLDIGLPDGSGLELIPLLDSMEHHTPVVIFTAQEVPEDIAAKVLAVMVKSKTANEQLIRQIKLATSRVV